MRHLTAFAVAALLGGPAFAQEPAAEAPKPAAEAPKAEVAEPAKAEAAAQEGDHPSAPTDDHAISPNNVVSGHTVAAERHAEHHEEEAGISNWWSWDYGPSAKDPSHKHLPPPFGFAILNFLIFLAIMTRLLFRPLGNMARDRHIRIKTELDAATKLRVEAEAKLKEFEQRTANVDQEVQSIVAQIEKEAAAEKIRIIAAAEAEAQRLKSDAEKQITTELARLKAELRTEIVDRVVAAAEEILKKQLNPDDQSKLVQSYVGKLEQAEAKS